MIEQNPADRRNADQARRALGQAKHIDRVVHAWLGRLHRIGLIMDRAGRTSQVEFSTEFDIKRKGHVMSHQLKVWPVEQMSDVAL